jgi:hypothetical protein
MTASVERPRRPERREIRMEDRQLKNRFMDVLCEEWEKASPEILGSETIYERLVSEGTEVPDGALNEFLDGLRGEGLITAAGFHDREAVRKHGGWAISGVRTDLLC